MQSAGIGIRLGVARRTAIVSSVAPSGPAAADGIEPGDELIAVGSWRVTGYRDLDTVASAVTGPPGSLCHLKLKRGDLTFETTLNRVPLDAIYPGEDIENLVLAQGTTLLAQTAKEWFGIRILEPDLPSNRLGFRAIKARTLEMMDTGAFFRIRYEWARSRKSTPLGDPSVERGEALADGNAGQALVVGPWRITIGRCGYYLACAESSSLPVKAVGADWLRQRPPWSGLHLLAIPRKEHDYERLYTTEPPRERLFVESEASSARDHAPSPLRGELPVRIRLLADDRPIANKRFRLELDVGRRATLPGPTAITDGHGIAVLRLPPGSYYVRSILQALPGGSCDLALMQPGLELAQEPGEGERIDAGTNRVTDVQLRVAAGNPTDLPGEPTPSRRPPLGLAADLLATLRGKPLQKLEVLRWLTAHPTANTRRTLLAICLFSAEQQGGVAYAARCSEMQARLAFRGLVTVLSSVDRSQGKLLMAARDWAPGYPPLAWLGPTGRSFLPTPLPAAVVFLRNDGLICDGLGPTASADAMEAVALRCMTRDAQGR